MNILISSGTTANDSLALIFYFIFSILLAIISYIYWRRHGKDHSDKSVYPRFDIPDKFSPGIVRYISEMGFDSTLVLASLIQLHQKGVISITDYESKGKFKNEIRLLLKKKIDKKDIGGLVTEDEYLLLELLFDDNKTFLLNHKNIEEVRYVMETLRKYYDINVKNQYVQKNYMWIYRFAIVIFSMLFPVYYIATEEFRALMILSFVVVLFNTVFISIFVQKINTYGVYRSGKDFWDSQGNNMFFLLGIILIFNGFFLYLLLQTTVLFLIPTFIISFSMIWLILFIDKRTEASQEALLFVQGLKLFLKATEEEKMKIMSSEGELSDDFMEEFLPYIVAFGIENDRIKNLTQILDATILHNALKEPFKKSLSGQDISATLQMASDQELYNLYRKDVGTVTIEGIGDVNKILNNSKIYPLDYFIHQKRMLNKLSKPLE